MFGTIGRSWEFAKISYGIIWDFKSLLVFPIVSTVAAGLVTASFLIPLWSSGTLEAWLELMDGESAAAAGGSGGVPIAFWVTAFLFYFCNYFVIIFFNAGLTACAMKVVNGESPTVGYGMSAAVKRFPQIFAWAVVSAVVGVLLKMIENANEKVGRFISAILGMAWTALTYFVVPVIVMEGVGPVEAFKRSSATLKNTWGTALVGNFSLGLLSFLVMLPVLAIGGFFAFTAFTSGDTATLVISIAFLAILIVLATAISSAADVIFKALLYNWATGKSVPDGVDTSVFDQAFCSK